jgi:hypothetical protein
MTSSSPSALANAADPAAGRVGGLLVMGLLLLGLTAATVAIAFQRGQTERCLAFYGADVAAAVSRAPHVELWQVTEQDGRLVAGFRRDISSAKGLVHLRRGLVEDANFDWQAAAKGGAPLSLASWDWAMVFAESAQAAGRGEATHLVFDLGDFTGASDAAGWISVVGQGGRIGLGRIGPGIATWIESTVSP